MNKTDSQPYSKKKQFIIFGICSLIALVLCMVTLVIVVEKVENETVKTDSNDSVNNFEMIKNQKGEPVKYIADVTAATLNNKFIKVDTFTDVSIDDSKISINGSNKGNDIALFSYIKNQLVSTIDSYYGEDYSGEFGCIYEKMPYINLFGIPDLICNTSVGLSDESGKVVYDENGVIVDGEYYFLTYTANGAGIMGEATHKAFNLIDIPEVKNKIERDISDVCKFSSFSAKPGDFTVRAKVELADDHISYIETEQIYNIKAELKFINQLADFGNRIFEFEYKVIQKYEYSYVGIELSQSELTLGKGEEASLSVTAVIEDNSDYKVTFKSSDKSIATVDELGYIKGIKESDKPVVITVTLDYLGESFFDECVVYVNSAQKDQGGVL